VHAEKVDATISTINVSLIGLREHWVRNRQDFPAILAQLNGQLKDRLIFQVSFTDARGMLVFSSADPAAAALDLSDREHVRVHLDGHGDKLFVSKAVLGRVSKKWSVQFTRPVYTTNGKFNGVIVASVAPAYLSRLYKQLDLGEGASIVLAREDGAILAEARRTTENLKLDSMLTGPAFDQRQGSTDGRYTRVSHIDGVERFFAWRYLSRYGLVIIVGQSVKDAYSAYSSQRNMYLGAGAAGTILLVLLGWNVLQTARSRHRTAKALKLALDEAAAARATLVDAIGCLSESFCLFDADDRLLLCNRIYAQSFTDFECFEDIAGMRFEDVARLSLAKGDVEGWIKLRLQRHRHPGAGVWVLKLGNGCWVEVSEQHTRSGGIVGVRRDVTAQKQIEQRQAMEYAVTLSLAESATTFIAAPKIMRTIGETLGWDCGAFWRWDKHTRLLACAESWSAGSTGLAQFMVANSAQDHMNGSAGLIGRVLMSGEPVWIADVCVEPGFLHAGVAARAGLHAAFAFPVRVGAELFGVMEFFIRHVREPDPALMTTARSVGSQIGQFIARKTAEDESRQLAFYDPLTGLPNRRLLSDRLQHALAAALRSKRHGGLLFIDLDNFKAINDTLGHDKGDLLLQQVASRLTGCVRVIDTVARQGGDEFVVMLTDLSEVASEAAKQAEAIGDKILEALTRPYQLGSHVYHNSASIGATLFDGQLVSTDEHLKRADLAMYQAKAAGRNTLRFFEADMQAVVLRRAALETDLRHSLQNDQFLLHYQAQIDAAGSVTGAEALLRWQHPVRGFTSPAEFIPAAEESGLILPLGRWVLETACLQLVSWSASAATARLTLAVNVSARQFRQPDFTSQVVELLNRTGADPRLLKLELTESMLLDNVEQIIDKMSALKVLGVGFALDDFGTGYSSLSYLKRLPLGQLKIDQSFVRDVLSDPNDAAIVRTILALAQSLGLEVIAEGVETAPQRDFLARHGCHAYQGYLFSQPVPLEQFEALNLGFQVQRNTKTA